jgi:aminoglycoside N3'-acetyltransferase
MTVLEKAFYWLRKRFYTFLIKKYVIQEQRTITSLTEAMQNHTNRVCCIHGGAKEINSFFEQYGGTDKLIQILETCYDVILSPAYTFSFKEGRVFHQKYSRPDLSWFSVAFERYAYKRTADPMHSLWIRGNVDLNQYQEFDTFSDKGIIASLDSKDATTISLGTDRVIISNIHYLEKKLGLPYRREVKYKGIVIDEENNLREIIHTTTENKYNLHFERERMEYDLLREGVLKRYDFGSLKLRIFNNEDFFNFLKRKTDKNPYYLFFERYDK